MADRPSRLLCVQFTDVNHNYTIYLGGNSPDNTHTPDGVVGPYDQKDYHLGQVGMQVFSTGSSGAGSNSELIALYKELIECGYGYYVAILPSLSALNVPLYYNGLQQASDGTPYPYIMFENNALGKAELHYYRADNTLVGNVFYSSQYYNHGAVGVTGPIYEDGAQYDSFDYIGVKPHYNGLIPSKWRFEWNVIQHFDIPYTPYPHQVINSDVIDDLYDYLPHTPDGSAQYEGEGDFDGASDPIAIPGLPTISPLDTGFTLLYRYTSSDISDLQNVANVTWDPNGLVSNIVAAFQDPMEAILNLSICPVTPDNQYLVPGTPVQIGNFTYPGVTGTRVKYPYKQINFGTLYIKEFWGNYLDYSPYSKLSIYLPYVGTQQISIDDVMNGGVALYANCDIFTGLVQYFLFSQNTNRSGRGHQSVLYTWKGNMKYDIPITGSNFNRAIANYVMDSIGSVVGLTSSATNPSSIPSATVSSLSSIIPNNQAHVLRGGSCSGNQGILGIQYPYLILERPEMTMPDNYAHSVGIPNETMGYLRNYTDEFVKVKGVHMEITSATSDELAEIEKLLKEGVVV